MRNRPVILGCAMVLMAASPDPTAGMLDSLQHAPTDQQAAALEQQLNISWRAAVSPAVQLLEDRATASLANQDARTAIGDLDAALDLQPDQALLWRLHAEARFANGDGAGAVADLAQALARERRCFPALADLSHFAEAGGDDAGALTAWRRLLEIDPHTPHAAARLGVLVRKVSGQPL